MSWLEDTEYHRKRQVAQMAKAFGDSATYFQKANDNELSEEDVIKTKKKKGGKSDMYKMRLLKLRKFNEQDQKEYVGVEDVENSYVANYENGDVVISKTTDGYLVSKFPIDTENEEGEEKDVSTLSEAIDVALQYKDDLDKAKAPEEIMYKKN
jgi:transcriptional regulator with XRE-family HTH domain